jgi:preprotein translocase subunit YajC
VISLLIIGGLLVVMWLVLVRPQRRRQLRQQDLLSELEPGVEVVTAGGLYGTVLEVDEDGEDLQLEIAPGTAVRVAKRAIAAVLPDEDEEGDEYEYEDDDEEELVAGAAEDEEELAAADPDDEPAGEEARSGSSRR